MVTCCGNYIAVLIMLEAAFTLTDTSARVRPIVNIESASFLLLARYVPNVAKEEYMRSV